MLVFTSSSCWKRHGEHWSVRVYGLSLVGMSAAPVLGALFCSFALIARGWRTCVGVRRCRTNVGTREPRGDGGQDQSGGRHLPNRLTPEPASAASSFNTPMSTTLGKNQQTICLYSRVSAVFVRSAYSYIRLITYGLCIMMVFSNSHSIATLAATRRPHATASITHYTWCVNPDPLPSMLFL